MTIKKAICHSLAAAGLVCGLGAQLALGSVSVSVQPQNPTSLVGNNVTFTAHIATTSGETITGYTWKESPDGNPPYSVIPNATGSSFTINNVQTSNAGAYFVSVTYNSGTNIGVTAVSTLSTLTVNDQARIVTQPNGLVRATGDTAVFSVTALGAAPLTYQWRANGTPIGNNGRINGAGTGTLTVSGLLTSDSGNYDVVVSNAYASVTSKVAKLTVLVPPAITVQPTNLTILVGDTAVLSVVSTGTTPLTYQWANGTNVVSNGGRISGAITGTLTIANAVTNDSGSYTVSVFNPVGSTNSMPVNLSVLLPPVITSPTNALGQQGVAFSYTATAIGSAPITFGADGLPDGLTIEPTNGIIEGIPTVSGVFNVTLYATNAAFTASTNLVISMVTGVPGITSPLTNSGQQGTAFTYIITASNNPVTFTATGLPAGLNLNPTSGIISGPPLLQGTFLVTITAGNQFGVDTEVLTLNLATGAPVITSRLTATSTENRANFSYTITASNSPTSFGAIGLPAGLIVNPTNGVISGTPTYGGTNNVIITAANAYGTGSNVLVLGVAYAKITQLAITDVTATYSKPYLLDFTFSLRDNADAVGNPSVGNAVVRSPDQLNIQCLEGNITDLSNQFAVPLGNETAFIVDRAVNLKLLKTFFVLDYSYSMFITPGAIDSMQTSVENLINQEPNSAQFGVVEFSADYVQPIQVTGFTSDKAMLTQTINGIQTNYVQGNYAGTRFYDAMATAISNYTSTNIDEEHYLILMSDGYDDSSLLPTTTKFITQADVIINMATNTNSNVKIYCVGFGPNPNTNELMKLTSQTGGRYYSAATPADLTTQFALLLKDVNSRYLLRWATLQRAVGPFQPMFTVNVAGVPAQFNTDFVLVPTNMVDKSMTPPVTNTILTNISLVPFFSPPDWATNVQQGYLSLVPDSDTNVSSVTLRSSYVPRYVRELRLHYRANYPVIPNLLSTNMGEILYGWSLSQTNDDTNGQWLTITSPSPSNVLSSLPYGIMGDFINFQFQHQALPNALTAFSEFDIDNSVYSNLPPSGQSFVLTTSNMFITNLPPTPPFGTPVPWLIAHGFTNNFDEAELEDPNTNGLTVWQDYIAGLDPQDPNSKFVVQTFVSPQPGQPPVVTFNSAYNRKYRVDATTALGSWVTLQDNIAGTGGPISIPDNRDLSGVNGVFYRVAVSFY